MVQISFQNVHRLQDQLHLANLPVQGVPAFLWVGDEEEVDNDRHVVHADGDVPVAHAGEGQERIRVDSLDEMLVASTQISDRLEHDRRAQHIQNGGGVHSLGLAGAVQRAVPQGIYAQNLRPLAHVRRVRAERRCQQAPSASHHLLRNPIQAPPPRLLLLRRSRSGQDELVGFQVIPRGKLKSNWIEPALHRENATVAFIFQRIALVVADDTQAGV
mmetsp:Transcript_10769/g.40423  ORF Transcript_10769/g.40423 Transcript_10769/m.40423 type:complete len:216 (+) Transcript_10769:275-922(+)